jgi:hypothetical protein
MAYNTYEAPFLSSYGKALEHYNAVTPIRGSNNVKPLGSRRYHKWAEIKKHGDEIHLLFERTLCVVWRPDDTFTVHAPHFYHSYQADKLAGWLPYGFYFLWDEKRLFVCHRTSGNKYHLPYKGKLEFVPTGTDGRERTYKCVTDTAPTEYKVRRLVADKLMRNRFEPFLAWAQVVIGNTRDYTGKELEASHVRFLSELGYTPEVVANHRAAAQHFQDTEYALTVNRFLHALTRMPFTTQTGNRRNKWFSRPACEHLFKLLTSDDYEQWPYVLDLIARQGGEYMYGRGGSVWSLSYEALEDYLKHLVSFLYRDRVFEVVPGKAGVIPSSRNAHFFTELEHVF